MKLEHRVKIPVHDTLEKYVLLSMVFCFFSFALPVHGKAENEPILPASDSLPSYGGKLDLSVQNETVSPKQDGAARTAESKIKSKTNSSEIKLHAKPQGSAAISEQGDNIMIVEGSRFSSQTYAPYPDYVPYPAEEYTNSANHNSGFYMNITNPDGSAVSFGSYLNSNSTSSGPRHQSRSQIVIDKKE